MNTFISIFNACISAIVLVLYPFIAVRRYFEYKYTQPEEARKIIQIGAGGLIGFLLIYVAFSRFHPSLFQFVLIYIGAGFYFMCMPAFVRVNYRLRGETPA